MIAVPAASIWTVHNKDSIKKLVVGTVLMGITKFFFPSLQSRDSDRDNRGLHDFAAERIENAFNRPESAQATPPANSPAEEVPLSPAREPLPNPVEDPANEVLSQLPRQLREDPLAEVMERPEYIDDGMGLGFSEDGQDEVEDFGSPLQNLYGNESDDDEMDHASYIARSPQNLFAVDEEINDVLEELCEQRVNQDVFSPDPMEFDPNQLMAMGAGIPLPIEDLPADQAEGFERFWEGAQEVPAHGVRLNPVSAHSREMEELERVREESYTQAPMGVNANEYAAKAVIEEGIKRGMPFGQIAKYCAGAVALGLTCWGFYKDLRPHRCILGRFLS